ncbi:MAG TPA: rod-binding protein [Syntrophales bacterium]|nr:rod-binding protein [Syntrophales bacterium]HOX93413.1 rod-binding protein [Syntrophales bacterium]HPI56632.1 rod-binding protein [Syntrophales bacterium]HPN24942.1 rod-binding protein [Syntrophales bacterium]HQM29751.1 rod-binding protein [Syntrophales bacterium]
MDKFSPLSAGLKRPAAPEKAGERSAEEEKKLKKACADFEAIFISLMFRTMRQTVPASGYFKAMPGKDVYNMMMDQKLAEDLAHRGGGLGIQELLYNQLTKPIHTDEENASDVSVEKD